MDRAAVAFDWLNGDVADLRRRYEECFAVADPGPVSWRTLEGEAGALRLMVQQPRGAGHTGRAILYFHGGGWIVGSPRTHADISRSLADATDLTVASVDYRLAPEHKAQATVLDGCRALADLLRDATMGVFLCGDSAGAAIALAVERRADEPTRRRVLGVGAFYGCFGLLDGASLRDFGARADGLDAACVERYWTLANDPRAASPYSIEALAAPSHVPVYLLAAGRDPLRDDTLALAAAYRACGRPHALDLVEGEAHGFLHGASAAATAAIGRVSSWIRSK